MSRAAAGLLLLAFVVLSLGTLGVRPLYKADESRYAEIPREMVASGDWTTPRLNGLKYFEKPPLQYWATAIAFELFGEHDWAARLWTALAGIAALLLVHHCGRKLFGGEAGVMGALVLAGCPLYVMLMQIDTLDMGLAFFLSAAVLAFALGRYYLFWAACALAVLSKGLIGIVLPVGAIGLYVLLKRDFSLLQKMKIVSGGALFLVICAPWFIAVSRANAEFAHFFFVQEHFQRFTTRMHGRYQPAWYFLPILAFGLAPWLLSFFASLRNVASRSAGAFDANLFLWIWVGVVFLFFSVSGSKLPAYILPIFPALALLVGRTLAASPSRLLLLVQSALGVAAGITLAVLAPDVKRFVTEAMHSRADEYARTLAAGGIVLAAGALGAGIAAFERKTFLAVALLAMASFGCTLLCVTGHRALSPEFSIAEQRASLGEIPKDARIFAVDFYDHTLPWYFRRTVSMVAYKDELEQPVTWEPGKFIPDLGGFARAWSETGTAYAVFDSEKFDSLSKQLGLPMQVVSRGSRYTIVRKP